MKYLLSGIVGFFLTLLVSLPFQTMMKQREARASVPGKSKGEFRIAVQDDQTAEVDVKIQPIVQIEEKKDEPSIKFLPQYPAQAAAQKIEGFVTLSFRVSKDGSVQNLKVTESSPPQIFDEAAMEAVSKWSFASGAKTRGERPVMEAQKLRLNFTLGRAVAVDPRSTASGF